MNELFEWVITELPRHAEGYGLVAASGGAPTETLARAEMDRYAMQYSQDGPIEVQLFKVTRQELMNYRVVPPNQPTPPEEP